LYLRTTSDGRVICGGLDEDFENEEKRDELLAKKTKSLEKKLKAIFPQLNSEAEFAWCGSFGSARTGLPSIGAIPGLKNCYAILAFGGNGITFSRMAAEMIRAVLTGHEDPDYKLFSIQ
jgi:glycine/D-amino acid oxidase-like deaminating enzyme